VRVRWIDRLARRLHVLRHRDNKEQELDDELRFHVDMEEQANVRRGLERDEARRRALVSFGGVEAVKEDCRDSWGVRLLETLVQDVRYGVRTLSSTPGFSAVVIATFALGIGANTAIFSVVDTVLLRRLPYERGDEIVVLRQQAPRIGVEDLGLSPLEIQDFREQNRTLDDVVEYHSMNFTLLGGSEPQRVQTGVVSAGFFDILQVKPLLGRAFRPGDDAPGAEAVLLLSYEFWKGQMGADPDIVGRTFEMNDRVHTVVGVLPPLPRYPDPNDVFMPTSACPFRSRAAVTANRQARLTSAFARTKAGMSLEQARADVAAIADRLRVQYPDAYPADEGYRAVLLPLREEMVRAARPTFLVLLATVALVLLIACANVANLIIARLSAREKEIAVRAALGAGRGRLIRQLLTETTLLALAGGAFGLLLAFSGVDLLRSFAGRFTPRASEVRLDGWVLAFTLALSVATGLFAGSLPGLPPWQKLVQAIGDGGGRSTAGGGRGRLRNALLVFQLALSFVLLIGAALTLRSFAELNRVDPGFRGENVLTLSVDLDFSRYVTPRGVDRDRVLGFHRPLQERVAALPGVVAVGAGWTFPLNSSFNNDGTFQIEGRPPSPGQPLPRAETRGVSEDYFRAIGVPVLRGRVFTEHDRSDKAPVVVVSQALARRHWGDEDPVGRRLSRDGGGTWQTIVGVVGDVRNASLDQPPRDTVYVSFSQFPGISYSYFVRTLAGPLALGQQIRRLVHAADAEAAVVGVRTLEEVRHESIASPRLTTLLLGLFAVLALTITAAGLSGAIAFSVSQRTHEIGIRLALGAEPRRVVGMLLWQGMQSVALGLLLGVLGALALTRLATGLLYGVAPTDVACFAASTVVLVGVATIACLVPARRATTIHPLVALRSL
jgi:putative ABC transport system permease protein